MEEGKTPSSPLPCNEILATLPNSLQARPSNVLQGSPFSFQEERKVLWGSREVLMPMRVFSSTFSQTDKEHKRKRGIKRKYKNNE